MGWVEATRRGREDVPVVFVTVVVAFPELDARPRPAQLREAHVASLRDVSGDLDLSDAVKKPVYVLTSQDARIR